MILPIEVFWSEWIDLCQDSPGAGVSEMQDRMAGPGNAVVVGLGWITNGSLKVSKEQE